MQFLPRLSLASYLSCLSLHSFLTTKRHPSDVEPSYISIFRLIQSAVYSVRVSKIAFVLCKWSIICNSKDLERILTKIDADNRLLTPDKCTKFQLDWSTSLWVISIFSSVRKDEEEKKSKEKKLKVCSLISRKCFARFSSNLVCSHLW